MTSSFNYKIPKYKVPTKTKVPKNIITIKNDPNNRISHITDPKLIFHSQHVNLVGYLHALTG